MPAPDIIFIALPAGDMPFVFPMGIIDLVHRLRRPVDGYYADDIPDEAIRKARIAVMPVHWFYSLKPAVDFSRRLRSVNPSIKIISGGFSAGAYPGELLRRSEIDFVIRGDAERPFVSLVNALLNGGDFEDAPNLTWRDGETPLTYQVDEKTLAESNNRDVSWFPSFERVALATQNLRDVAFIFPWIVVARGCCFDCEQCFASRASQQYLAGRGMVCRPPEAVKDDLCYWSKRKDIRWCHFNSDFHATMKNAWTKEILDQRYDLDAYYECYRIPETDFVDDMINSFRMVHFGMFYRPDAQCAHASDRESDADFNKLHGVLRHCGQRARILLYVTPQLVAGHPEYYKQTRRLAASGRVDLKNYDESIVPPIARQKPEERIRGFEHLFDESITAQGTLRRQHRILTFAMAKFPPLFRFLCKIAIARVRWNMFFAHLIRHGFRRRF